MPTRKPLYPVLLDTEKVVQVWKVGSYSPGDLLIAEMQQKADDLRALDAEIDQLRDTVQAKVDQTAEGIKELKDLIKRTHSMIRAMYGEDSNEYIQAAGKRPGRSRSK